MNQHSQAAAAQAASANPLFDDWSGPFGVPPFGRIAPQHFLPAFARAFAAHEAEVAAIAADAAEPTFANTIDALETAGDALTRASNVFYLLAGAHTNDAIQEIERELAPLAAKHWNRILMNEAPVPPHRCAASPARRSSALPRSRSGCSIATTRRYKRAGAALDAAAKARLGDINERLATLGTTFSQNVLADEQGYTLVLDGEDDLAGLPDFVRAAAQAAAEERGLAGKHVITLSRSSVEPFLQFSSRRDLREKAFAPGSRAATAAARPTTRRSLPRWWRCAPSARGCSAIRRLRITGSTTPWPRRRRRCVRCSRASGCRRAAAPGRSRRAAGRWSRRRAAISSSPPGTGATTPRSCARGVATSTRRRSSRTSSSTASSRRRSTPRNRCSG